MPKPNRIELARFRDVYGDHFRIIDWQEVRADGKPGKRYLWIGTGDAGPIMAREQVMELVEIALAWLEETAETETEEVERDE